MIARSALAEITTFHTRSGVRIYRLPLEAFPGFWVYAYVVLNGQYRVLIDTGSGLGNSHENLLGGLARIGEDTGTSFEASDLTHILVTHGHIDHFGGLMHLAPGSSAKIGIHGLDRRTLVSFEERLVVTSRRLERFFIEAGVSPALGESLLEMYLLPKSVLHSVRVDFTYEQVGMRIGPMEVLHTPGHCAGQVVFRLEDVLFSGDHVLASITPHQAPESLTLNTGLRHYLHSLDAVEAWARDVRLVLGGHGEPVYDLQDRLVEIRESHRIRLITVLEILEQPATISDVSAALFESTSGYNSLLALEETGAHLEYLYQYGLLRVGNLSEIERRTDPVPLVYAVADPALARELLDTLISRSEGHGSKG